MVFQTHVCHFKVLFWTPGPWIWSASWVSPFWISSLVNEDGCVAPATVAWQMWSLNLLPGNKMSLAEAGAVPQSPPFHRSTDAQVSAKGRPLLGGRIGSSCLPLVVKARHQRCRATRRGLSCYQKPPNSLIREVSKFWGPVYVLSGIIWIGFSWSTYALTNCQTLIVISKVTVTNETRRAVVRLVM